MDKILLIIRNIYKDNLYNISIDYADNSLRGVLKDTNKEIIILFFKDYGILLDNRIGKGYNVNFKNDNIYIELFK